MKISQTTTKIRLYTDKEMRKLLKIPEEEELYDVGQDLNLLVEFEDTGEIRKWKVTTTLKT